MRAAIRVRVVAAVALAIVVGFAISFEGSARAFDDFAGTRAVGMGDATRAWALADSALLLNPSGMSLAKAYNLEASYAYGSRLREQFLHASVVDSTSATNLAGGLYYTYRFDHTTGLAAGHGHEVGGALSLPIGTSVAVGATLKWFRLVGADNSPATPATGTWDGLTTDVGVTVRPDPTLSFAVVGANLVDKHREQVPRLVTYGSAYLPIPEIILALDGVTGTRGTGLRAGIEGALAQRVALRAGGGTDPVVGMGYLAAGFSAVSEVGAVDVGVRGDLFAYRPGATRNLFVGVSLRLFVPGAVASAAAAQSP
jgi:hypothetical protein